VIRPAEIDVGAPHAAPPFPPLRSFLRP